MDNSNNKICVTFDKSLSYPETAPYNPTKYYPESPFRGELSVTNDVYPAIRNSFKLMNLDIENYGTKNWSPLSQIINKGETVLIKPNLVYDKNLSGESILSVITHTSFIRTAIDYVYKATGDSGKIIIADAPQNDADFEKIITITGLKKNGRIS